MQYFLANVWNKPGKASFNAHQKLKVKSKFTRLLTVITSVCRCWHGSCLPCSYHMWRSLLGSSCEMKDTAPSCGVEQWYSWDLWSALYQCSLWSVFMDFLNPVTLVTQSAHCNKNYTRVSVTLCCALELNDSFTYCMFPVMFQQYQWPFWVSCDVYV